MLFKSGPRIKLKHTQARQYFRGTWNISDEMKRLRKIILIGVGMKQKEDEGCH